MSPLNTTEKARKELELGISLLRKVHEYDTRVALQTKEEFDSKGKYVRPKVVRSFLEEQLKQQFETLLLHARAKYGHVAVFEAMKSISM